MNTKTNTMVKTEASIVKQETNTKTNMSHSVKATKKSRTKISFEQRLMECTAFKTKFGHCKINTNGMDSTKGLGIWTQEVRRNFKLQLTTGKPRTRLSEQHIQQLNGIGFHWGFTPKPGVPQSDAAWNATFAKVEQYHNEYHTFNIQVKEEEEKNNGGGGGNARLLYLAEWVCDQRDQKKRRDSKMKCNINKQRVNLLTQIHFNWDGPRKFSSTEKN